MKKYWTILLFSLLMTGCNSSLIPQNLASKLIQAPEVRGVQLKSFSIEQQSVVFDVAIFNPNIFPLPISGLRGDLKLNEVAVGSMAATSTKSLAANTTQVVTLPLQLSTAAFMNAAKTALSTRKASYSFNGGIETSVGTLPFTKKGDLSLTEIVTALLP